MFYVKMVQIRSVCGEICQICTEKWGSRHKKLSMRPITGKPHAQVQTKIQSTAGLWVPSLELASHGAHAQSTYEKHPFFWLSQPPLVLYAYSVFNPYFTVLNVPNDRMTHPRYIYISYKTVYLVTSLPEIAYTIRMYMVLVNPRDTTMLVRVYRF